MPFWLWSICSGGNTSEFLEVQGEREEHSSCAASSGSGLVTVNKHPAFTPWAVIQGKRRQGKEAGSERGVGGTRDGHEWPGRLLLRVVFREQKKV